MQLSTKDVHNIPGDNNMRTEEEEILKRSCTMDQEKEQGKSRVEEEHNFQERVIAADNIAAA